MTHPRITIAIVGVVLAAAVAIGIAVNVSESEAPPTANDSAMVEQQVKRLCAACHTFPPPSSFPKHAWAKEVKQGYDFYYKSDLEFDLPTQAEAREYFESRAPDELPIVVRAASKRTVPVQLETTDFPRVRSEAPPEVSHIQVVRLTDESQPTLLVCDVTAGAVAVLEPQSAQPKWKTLARVLDPARAEVVDLDRDGIRDVIVASLGSIIPTDAAVGKVVWLRGRKDGTFSKTVLLSGVGRVADVRAADFNRDGKTDLVVAEFGWREIGSIVVLENQTTDWNEPKFKRRTLDERHGAIHVPVADLNGDGRPDFVALISQDHETIVAFLNTPEGFEKRTLWSAPHPAWGSSGIQLLDFDGDRDLDIVYTNGDTFDSSPILKPHHGVSWLENTGDLRFVEHSIGKMYGIFHAEPVDIDSDGDLDLVAVSLLPDEFDKPMREYRLESVVLFEQVAKHRFERHVIQRSFCRHATCAAGDLFGTGRKDIAIGYYDPFSVDKTTIAVRVLRNLGDARKISSKGDR